LQVIRFGDIYDRLCADRAFEMDVNLGLGDGIVLWVEVFHGQSFLPQRAQGTQRDLS
jgi:hypothetical protein